MRIATNKLTKFGGNLCSWDLTKCMSWVNKNNSAYANISNHMIVHVPCEPAPICISYPPKTPWPPSVHNTYIPHLGTQLGSGSASALSATDRVNLIYAGITRIYLNYVLGLIYYPFSVALSSLCCRYRRGILFPLKRYADNYVG